MLSAAIPSEQIDNLQPGTAFIVFCGFLPKLHGECSLQLQNCEKISVVAMRLSFMETFLCAFECFNTMIFHVELDGADLPAP